MKTLAINLPKQGLLSYWMRCLMVGVAYSAANFLVVSLLGTLSRQSASLENAAVWTLTGTLLALVFSPLITRSRWPQTRTILAFWAAQTCVRSLGLGIEGSLFKPASINITMLGVLTGMAINLLVAWMAVSLFSPAGAVLPVGSIQSRAWWGWVWRVLLVGLAYCLFYFIFGATNALLYTLSFYKNNPQYGLSLPPANLIFLAQLVRGPLFGLGSLVIARSVNLPRRSLALWLGLLLFVIGGAAPYLETTFRSMPLGFNLATLTEILFQNVLTGVVAAYLFWSSGPEKKLL